MIRRDRAQALRAVLGLGLRALERLQRDEQRAAARALDAAARSREPAMRQAFADSVRALRRAISEPAIAEALEQGRTADALNLVPWDSVAPDLQAAWQETLAELAEGAARLAARQLPGVSVDLADRHAAAAQVAARARAAELVTAIGDGQRQTVRDLVSRIFGPDDLGNPKLAPQQAAQLIGDTVGLLPRQAGAASRLYTDLLEEGVSAPRARRALQEYARRGVRQRGDMIARTETLTAVGKGQQATWEGAVDEGVLDEPSLERVWLVTDDDRLDLVVCAPMDEQRVGLREPFTTGDGRRVMTIPAHPGCRCSVVLEVGKRAPAPQAGAG